MKQFLVQFKHDSRHLGYNGIGQLLVDANNFEDACFKIKQWSTPMVNDATGYTWEEEFDNARDFINLTV